MATRLTDWRRGGYARDRWNATASTRAHRGGKLVSVTLTRLPSGEQDVAVVRWERDRPEPWQRISRCWRAMDRDGGRWSIELGHDGRWWVLFGPEGVPFGDESLSTRVEGALEVASVWIATQMSPLRDVEQHAVAGGSLTASEQGK